MGRPRKYPRIQIGDRFGRLVIVGPAGMAKGGKQLWQCQCSCGNTTTSRDGHLVKRLALSCGCLSRDITAKRNTTHGLSHTGAYTSWKAMMGRCYRPSAAQFHRYGGRGIEVCERWHTFENFLADMGDRPEGRSIDRFPDGDGNYEPGNCRWATRAEQNHDRTFNHYTKLTHDTAQEALGRIEHGESQASVARRLGVTASCVSYLYRGDTWKDLDRPWLRGHGEGA